MTKLCAYNSIFFIVFGLFSRACVFIMCVLPQFVTLIAQLQLRYAACSAIQVLTLCLCIYQRLW